VHAMDNVQKILVPTDFTETSEGAMQTAIAMARRYDATVIFLHAYHISVYSFPDGAYVTPASVAAEVSAAAQRGLDALVARFAGSGAKVTAVLREGIAHEEIASAAAELGADLIVIGTRGRKGLTRALLGSVAETVIRSVDQPVLVVRVPDPAK
jgi:nucleotide-binding universal stress UspA family protein